MDIKIKNNIVEITKEDNEKIKDLLIELSKIILKNEEIKQNILENRVIYSKMSYEDVMMIKNEIINNL